MEAPFCYKQNYLFPTLHVGATLYLTARYCVLCMLLLPKYNVYVCLSTSKSLNWQICKYQDFSFQYMYM